MDGNQLTDITASLLAQGYVVDGGLAKTLGIMAELERPLLIEGEAGVGKTEVAKALAAASDAELIRLQCYDGLDINAAVYEWNYTRQLISIRLEEARQTGDDLDVFSEDFLLERPLLRSIRHDGLAVLLIDEIDRADEAFEAYLLELLSDFQVSIPELGTVRCTARPMVILTSNGTREISDALRRRCLYHYLDYPTPERELEIVRHRHPQITHELAGQIVRFVQQVRSQDLRKKPGIAETLDWSAALLATSVEDLTNSVEAVMDSRSCFLKTREDMAEIGSEAVTELLEQVG